MRRVVDAGRRPAPAASSPAVASGGSARRANGPWRSRPALAVAARRGATRRRRGAASANRSRASSAAANPAIAPRTSSGFFCQWRRMNCAGRQAAEQRRGLLDVHASLCDNRPMEIAAPLRRRLTWRLEGHARRRARRARRAGGILLRRRRPARQDRGGAAGPGAGLATTCTSSPNRRSATTTRARLLRAARDLSRATSSQACTSKGRRPAP